MTASGTLDVARYGQLLKPRRLVNVRGAGADTNGLFYVQSVTTKIQRGAIKQSFNLTRNARGSYTAKVAV